MLIKALAVALIEVPECNVSISGDQLLKYSRADISVAVSIPGGLITPIVAGADTKSLSAISKEMKDLAGRAKEGKLQPHEYQGGTASLSNMGMYGIKQFDAVINPPQGMIMAIGAGEKRPYVINDSLQIATVMSATGSFDHRAIDGADGARLMQAFKRLVETARCWLEMAELRIGFARSSVTSAIARPAHSEPRVLAALLHASALGAIERLSLVWMRPQHG